MWGDHIKFNIAEISRTFSKHLFNITEIWVTQMKSLLKMKSFYLGSTLGIT